MEQYITSTELKQNLKRAKEYARVGIVHILEHGHAGYVLCSTDIYDEALRTVRKRAAWQAEVREACRESLRDTTLSLANILPRECKKSTAKISQTAAHDLVVEYDGRLPSELAYAIERVQADPAFGLAVELDDLPCPVWKVLVPPYDLLYTRDSQTDDILFLGLITTMQLE